MDFLEKEILKYEKKGFEVIKKHGKPLKHGSRVVLIKKVEGLVVDTEEAVYIYFVNGDSTTKSYREFFKDYERFFENHNFDEDDRGIFLCSGRCDERLFKDLKKEMVEDDDVYNSIKLIALSEATEKEPEEKQPRTEQKETREVKEQPRTEKKEAIDETIEILNKIKKLTIHRMPNTEKDLDNMVVSYLSAFFPDIQTQVAYQNARIDAQIGNVGIEIKFQPDSSEFDRLYGQTEKYLDSLEKVIVVIGYERTRELTKSFEKRVERRGWLNSKVFIITLR